MTPGAMDDEQIRRREEIAEVYEKGFLALSALMLVAFLGALFYAAFAMDIQLPSEEEELSPTEVRQTEHFSEPGPGVYRTGPGEYEVVLLGSAWRFNPAEIEVPAGSRVTFVGTSADVLHGFHIEETRVNVMLIPGEVTRVSYTFSEPGHHDFVCHEYCGIGHHQMYGELTVTERSDQ